MRATTTPTPPRPPTRPSTHRRTWTAAALAVTALTTGIAAPATAFTLGEPAPAASPDAAKPAAPSDAPKPAVPETAAPQSDTSQAAAPQAETPRSCPSDGCVAVSTTVPNADGVAVDETTGKVYVVTTNATKTLYEMDPDGQNQRAVISGLGHLESVALDDGEGNAYVTDHTAGILYEVKLADGTKRTVADGLGKAYGLGLDGKGNAYVADTGGGKLYEVKLADRTVRTVASGLGKADGLAVNPADGHIYVSDSAGHVWSVDPVTGRKCEIALDAKLNGLALDASGTLYGTDYSDKLYAVNPVDGSRRVVATGMGKNDGAVVDRSGNVYVTDRGAGKLWKLPGLANAGDRAQLAVTVPKDPDPAAPGQSVFPEALISNSGKDPVGKQTVTLTAGDGLAFPNAELFSWKDPFGPQRKHPCEKSTDSKTLTCKDVELNLDAHQDIKVWVQLNVDSAAAPGSTSTVSFKAGDHASAEATVTVK